MYWAVLGRVNSYLSVYSVIFGTRSYAALRAADLDWIVGPGYSLDVTNVTNAGSQMTWEGGRAGISKYVTYFVTHAGSQLTF